MSDLGDLPNGWVRVSGLERYTGPLKLRRRAVIASKGGVWLLSRLELDDERFGRLDLARLGLRCLWRALVGERSKTVSGIVRSEFMAVGAGFDEDSQDRQSTARPKL